MRFLVALLCFAGIAHATPSATSKPDHDLQLTATVEPATLAVTVELRNVGKKPLVVHSHVEAGERHYDPYTIILEWPSLENKACTKRNHLELSLLDNRDESAMIDATIQPGRSISHKIDAPAWARRAINGTVVLGGGYYKVSARYRVKSDPRVWNGTLETSAIRVVALDQQRVDMCKPANWDTW